MLYVYNPTRVPQILGRHSFAPESYQVIDEKFAQTIRDSQIALIVEGDANFPMPWARHIPAGLPELSSA